jgi:hypothetical protein
VGGDGTLLRWCEQAAAAKPLQKALSSSPLHLQLLASLFFSNRSWRRGEEKGKLWLGDLEVQDFCSACYCPALLASELFSGGLLATCIRHPARPKGCTTAAHLLFRSDLAFSRHTSRRIFATCSRVFFALLHDFVVIFSFFEGPFIIVLHRR